MVNLKVLIVCENASSSFGGEAMLPLNYFLLLSERLAQVYLLTHERTRSHIETIPGIKTDHIFYIPDTWAHRMLNSACGRLPDRVASVTTGALMHLITQIYQWRMARSIVRKYKIDIVHEPSPVSPKQPSMLFALGCPVVIGPMNGGMSFPPAFNYLASRAERWLYGVMRMFASIYNLLIPGKLFAAVLLVANQRTRDALPLFKLGQVLELVENGVFLSKIRSGAKLERTSDLINVIYVGRLVDWKVVDIAIEAVGICSNQNVRLVIVGDGIERSRLEQYASSVAAKKVRFVGSVPHAMILDCYDDADIFVLPSVRECGGAVVLEAMARGLPVIATDWGGPADYVTSDTGVLVAPLSREYMVAEFARNIDELASDAELRLKYGIAAIERVAKYFLWEKKVDVVLQIYQSAIPSVKFID